MNDLIKIFGIFGFPVHHSKSPKMYNGLFQSRHIDAIYLPFLVSPAHLPNAIRAAIALDIQGFHLTIPHKEAILPFLNEIRPMAQILGAVNCVSNRNGYLIGDNTDGFGFVASATEESSFQVQGSQSLIFGAGGSARAIAGALAAEGAQKITLLNRTVEKASDISAALAPHFPATTFESLPLSHENFLASLEHCHLLVNALAAAATDAIRSWTLITASPDLVVADINYYDGQSPLLENARRHSLTAITGHGMLVHQGVRSLPLLMELEIQADELRRHLLA